MKTPEERGPIGWWAYQERDNRDWSVDEVRARLTAEGVHISDSTIRGIESGHKKASARVIRGLEKVFSSPSPDTKKEATEPELSGLISALEAQTEAINRLVAAMETSGGGLPDRVAQRLAVRLGLLPPPDDEAPHEENSGTRGSGDTALRGTA